ncbi:MAG: hypothetical protein DMG35_07725 [Acidobacteria bacterium]|nr:MAG: hypothetical protein DMG35_07725 [Acidobacteriota bacterium]
MTIIVVLMHRHNHHGRVHDGIFRIESFPDEPVVPKHPPNYERRHVRFVRPGRKQKIIDPLGRSPPAFPQYPGAQPRLPIPDLEIHALADLGIPAPPHHQKFRMRRPHALHCIAKILHQNDVAIDVAENIVPRDLLRPAKHGVQSLGAQFVALDAGLVAKSQFLRCLRRAFLIPEQNHFHARP